MSQVDSQTVPCEPARETAAPAKKVNWRRTALRVGGSALALTVLFIILPREDLWNALRRVPPTTWLAALAAYLSLHVVSSLKYRVTVNLTGADLGVAQAVRCYYGGLFGSIILPSIVGGDVIRAGLAFRQARSRTGLILGSLLDRLIDLAALGTVATVGALLLTDQFEFVGRKVLLPLAGVCVVGAAVLAAVLFLVPARRLPFKLRRQLARLRQAARPVARRPQYVVLAWAMGVAVQTTLVLLNAWLGRACGLECPLAVWLFVWPLAKLSGVLPVTQGGVGVREAALAALFVPFGVAAAVAVAVGLVFQSVVISGGLLGGAIALALGRLPQPQGGDRLPATGRGVRRKPCKSS